jgi:hypothetical protein
MMKVVFILALLVLATNTSIIVPPPNTNTPPTGTTGSSPITNQPTGTPGPTSSTGSPAPTGTPGPISSTGISSTGSPAATSPTFIDGTFLEGLSAKLGFTESQVGDVNTCVESLGSLVDQLKSLIQEHLEGSENTQGEFPTEGDFPTEGNFPTEGDFPTEGNFPTEGGFPTEGSFPSEGSQDSFQPDIEGLVMALFTFYQDAQYQIEEDCGDVASNLESVLSRSATSDLGAIIQANWETNFPKVIQKLGEAIKKLVDGDEYGAGTTVGTVLRSLAGLETIQVTTQSTTLPKGKAVAFDVKKFIPKFFDMFFKTLKVTTASSKDILTCVTGIQTISNEFTKFNTEMSKPTLTLFDRLDKSAAFYGKAVDTVKGCQNAVQKTGDIIVGRIYRAIIAKPDQSLYQIFLNTFLNFASIQQSIELEATYIALGQYDNAGKTDATRFQSMLSGVVNFAVAEAKPKK